MEAKEMKKLDTQALKEMISTKRGEAVKLRFDFFRKGSKGNVRELRKVKKDLARALTIITQREHER